MKYYCNLHSRWGYPMWKIEGNNKKKLIEEAQWHMERLSKKAIEMHYLHLSYNQL